MIENIATTDIYTDGIGDLEDLGDNVRLYYFTWVRSPSGGMERHLVAKMIRPKKSLLLSSETVIDRLLAERRSDLAEPVRLSS